MLNTIRQLNRERVSLSSSGFWILCSVAITLSVFQTTEIFSFFGVKINLILAFIVALNFSEILGKDYLLISIFLIFFSKFIPGIDMESLSILLMIILFFLTSKFFSTGIISIYCLTLISTFIFYAILDYGFLIDNLFIVFIEALLNAIFSLFLYSLVNRIKSF